VSALKASFDDPSSNWVMLTLRAGDAVLDVTFAATPNNGFLDIALALDNVLDPPCTPTAVLHDGGHGYYLEFRRDSSEDDVILEIIRRVFHRPSREGELLLSVRGTVEDVVVPLWRALSALRGRLSDEQLARGWRWPFPDRELAQLAARLRARRG
jgi:hypothetical protein